MLWHMKKWNIYAQHSSSSMTVSEMISLNRCKERSLLRFKGFCHQKCNFLFIKNADFVKNLLKNDLCQ